MAHAIFPKRSSELSLVLCRHTKASGIYPSTRGRWLCCQFLLHGEFSPCKVAKGWSACVSLQCQVPLCLRRATFKTCQFLFKLLIKLFCPGYQQCVCFQVPFFVHIEFGKRISMFAQHRDDISKLLFALGPSFTREVKKCFKIVSSSPALNLHTHMYIYIYIHPHTHISSQTNSCPLPKWEVFSLRDTVK